MLKDAILFSREQSISVLQTPEPEPRGDLKRRLSAQDLFEFGRCPYRWVWGEDPEEPWLVNGPTLTEWMAFDRTMMERVLHPPARHLREPEARMPEVPLGRPGQDLHQVRTAPAQHGRAAALEQRQQDLQGLAGEGRGRATAEPVPGPEWDRAQMGADAILEDKAIQEIIKGSVHLRTLHGTWVDEATGLEIPVWSRATLVPSELTPTIPALVQLVECRNADPRYWEGIAYSTGLHIARRAAAGAVEQARTSRTCASTSGWSSSATRRAWWLGAARRPSCWRRAARGWRS